VVLDVPNRDEGPADVTPDGRWALVVAQDTGTAAEYNQSAVLVDRGTGAERTAFRPNGRMVLGGLAWSGTRFLAAPGMLRPKVYVLSLLGDTLATLGAPEGTTWKGTGSWCPGDGGFVTTLDSAGVSLPVEVEVATGSIHRLHFPVALVRRPICLPNHFAAWTLDSEGRASLMLLERSTGEATTLSVPPRAGAASALIWVPDEAPDPVVSLRLSLPGPTIRTGARADARAEGLRWGGGSGPVPVQWVSRDREVASVGSDGAIVGLRPGHAWLVATYERSLADSIEIGVEQGPVAALLFADSFTALDTSTWQVGHAAHPTIVEIDGRPALSQNGDGRYVDPVRTRKGFRAEGGLNVEVDVRIPIVGRTSRQRLHVCLDDGGAWPDLDGTGQGTRYCVKYPESEDDAFDPGRGALYRGDLAVEEPVRFDDPEWSSEWHRLALQIQPDGALRLVADGEELTRSRWPVRFEGTEWRVVLAGAAVETQLLYRNLEVWRGVRW